jgi:hypothetical protein
MGEVKFVKEVFKEFVSELGSAVRTRKWWLAQLKVFGLWVGLVFTMEYVSTFAGLLYTAVWVGVLYGQRDAERRFAPRRVPVEVATAFADGAIWGVRAVLDLQATAAAAAAKDGEGQ